MLRTDLEFENNFVQVIEFFKPLLTLNFDNNLVWIFYILQEYVVFYFFKEGIRAVSNEIII